MNYVFIFQTQCILTISSYPTLLESCGEVLSTVSYVHDSEKIELKVSIAFDYSSVLNISAKVEKEKQGEDSAMLDESFDRCY